jgi:hypothetical protein
VCLLIGAATAAQLPNSYIPPNARSAGGNAGFLQTPKASARPNNQYVPPSSDSQRGAGASADAQAETLRYDNSPNTGDGSYSYA